MSNSKAFTGRATPYALSTLTNFSFSHDITWSTWSYKRFTGRLHAPNHTACIMQVSWRCGIIKTPFLSALCSHRFHFPPLASWIQTLQSHRSSPSLINFSYTTRYLFTSFWILLSRFSSSFSDTAISWEARPPSGLNLHYCFFLILSLSASHSRN